MCALVGRVTAARPLNDRRSPASCTSICPFLAPELAARLLDGSYGGDLAQDLLAMLVKHDHCAFGAATAAGLRPVPDPPGRSPRTWQLSGNRAASHARPRTPPEPRKTRLDTAPPLQG